MNEWTWTPKDCPELKETHRFPFGSFYGLVTLIGQYSISDNE